MHLYASLIITGLICHTVVSQTERPGMNTAQLQAYSQRVLLSDFRYVSENSPKMFILLCYGEDLNCSNN